MRWVGGLPIIPRIVPRSRAPIRQQNLAVAHYSANSGLMAMFQPLAPLNTIVIHSRPRDESAGNGG